jgi:hypothetical protein
MRFDAEARAPPHEVRRRAAAHDFRNLAKRVAFKVSSVLEYLVTQNYRGQKSCTQFDSAPRRSPPTQTKQVEYRAAAV